MIRSRVFLRLPVFDSVDEALTFAAENGLGAPVLHSGPSVRVVGCAELGAVPAEELRGADEGVTGGAL